MFDYQDFGGLRGLAPVLPSGSPHRPIARFHSNPPIIAEYAPMRGKIAAVCVKIRNVDFDVHDSTTLPISGFNVAMCGDDEVARNGGAGSKKWKEVGVVSQSSFRHPRRRRTLFRRAQGTEYRLKCVWVSGASTLTDKTRSECSG